jgi:very-short-patch-repair endonuclease
LDLEFEDDRLAAVAWMLEKHPANRPTLDEVIKLFSRKTVAQTVHQRGRRVSTRWEKNTVLFPARMGIPHKGHIEYLVRILELGFHPIISLQRSYTLTERDPLPKWIVMKMVAQSLFDRGFEPDDVHFIFTPLYKTAPEMQMHFTMMPGFEDVVAVASSNPDVQTLFPSYAIIDQRVVFGLEGETYEDRSWGEILRRSVREGDRLTFSRYAASGVERIMSFEELQAYQEPVVDFVRGAARVSVSIDGALHQTRTLRHLSPEEALIRTLRVCGESVDMIDPFAKDSLVQRNGRQALLHYCRTEVVGDDVYLRYELIHL